MSKKYRAVFQGMDPDTNGKHAILLISVGQEYHEGSKLLAAVELINRSYFDRCTVMVADTLQRHNYLELSEQEAYQLAFDLGTQWVDRNSEILSKLTVPYKIIRWDSHREPNPISDDYRKKLIENYRTEDETKRIIDATITGYLERQDNLKIDLEKFYQNCFNYVLEESPILMPLWATQGYDYIIYPKRMTSTMRLCYEKFVVPNYPDKVMWLPLRFRKKMVEVEK